MTSKDLNLKLIEFLPEIKEEYIKETSWQDGDDTGSHVIYGDVFIPFIKEKLNEQNKASLTQIFEFIEYILSLNDGYANEVIAFSVLESLIFDEEVENALFMQFARSKTLKTIEEIIS